jgi:hypothetical protein
MENHEQDSLMIRIAMRGPKANARVHAMLLRDKENEARPGAVKIQPADVDFIAMAADKAPDVNDFLAVI